jgi:N4-gp56 family major capsid protein
MAATDFPVSSPLAVKRWSSELLKETLKKTSALQFMGEGTNNLLQIKTEVNKDAGDRITFGLRQQLTGAGIQGDGTLEGNEEALVTYSQNVTIDQLRHAVRSGGKMSEQRVPFSVRDEARDGLSDWWADRIDYWMMNQLAGNTGQSDVRYTGMQATTAFDSDHVVYCGTGSTSTEAAISASTDQLMTLSLIDKAVEKAKVATNQMRKVMVNNKDYYVMFLHPYQATDLRTNTSTGQWLDIQKSYLQGSGSADSPIFTGALGVYNGVILFESIRMPAAVTNSNARRAVLCGAQAAVMAFGRNYGKNTFSWKEELFDYENQLGVSGGCVGGLVKTRFNGSDFASIVVTTRAVAH